MKLINGVPIASFSEFSNKLEVGSASFQLVSDFTLDSTSDGINPLTEVVTLVVGSYAVTIRPGLFHQNSEGYYSYEGTIGGEHLELRIVPNTRTSYTLNAEGSGVPITLGKSPGVVLMIGNDMGAGAASLDG